jgi:ribonuclease Z
MRCSFLPRLINRPFENPGLLITFAFIKRALLLDLGKIDVLSSKDILKISHIFVSHTHMDHFIGFDRLLRLFAGRDKTIHLYGPCGFIFSLFNRGTETHEPDASINHCTGNQTC